MMNDKMVFEQFGFKTVNRPHIKAIKTLDLTGLRGKAIIEAETKKVLRIHRKTFAKLAAM